MQNKVILELCLSSGLGGLEMFVSSCYKIFSSQCKVFLAVSKESKLDFYISDEEKLYIQRSKFFPVFPALKLAKFIDENDVDILHFHWNKDIITAVLAKVLSKKKPKLVQSRHMGMTRFKDDFYHRWIYKNIDMIHAVTLEVKEQLKKYIPLSVRPRIEMVYLGVKQKGFDLLKVEKLKQKYSLNGEFIVGIVGRIEEAKGQYKVIEALSLLQNLPIKLFIVGSAMEELYLDSLKQKVKELSLEDKVIFTGFTKDVSEYMQLFDVNILATQHETFGLVIIEAMLNKIPVIATNRGGPLEIIEDGVDGLLFNGEVLDLEKKIQILYENRTLLETIKENGYKKVCQSFNEEIQMEKLFSIIV